MTNSRAFDRLNSAASQERGREMVICDKTIAYRLQCRGCIFKRHTLGMVPIPIE